MTTARPWGRAVAAAGVSQRKLGSRPRPGSPPDLRLVAEGGLHERGARTGGRRLVDPVSVVLTRHELAVLRDLRGLLADAAGVVALSAAVVLEVEVAIRRGRHGGGRDCERCDRSGDDDELAHGKLSFR